MYSMLDVIQSGLIACVTAMNVSGGYNYSTGTVQQLDFTKAQFPLYNVFLNPEERSMDASVHPNMNAFRSEAMFDIYCYNRMASEVANNQFEIDHILNAMLHDIKKMIGNNPTIRGTCEYLGYLRSRREISGLGDDIFIPKILIVTVNVMYSEDSRNPSEMAYC